MAEKLRMRKTIISMAKQSLNMAIMASPILLSPNQPPAKAKGKQYGYYDSLVPVRYRKLQCHPGHDDKLHPHFYCHF